MLERRRITGRWLEGITRSPELRPGPEEVPFKGEISVEEGDKGIQDSKFPLPKKLQVGVISEFE